MSVRPAASARLPAAHAGALRATDVLVAAVIGALAFALYLRTLAPGLLWGDSAELQFAAWLGGLAHPTGYPLYLMLGWLWSHLLPWHDPAWRMNLFSALWGGVAVGLLYLVIVRFLGANRPAGWAEDGPSASAQGSARAVRLIAAASALLFATTPTFWSQAVIAEVYTLNAVFVAALLLTLLGWAEVASLPEGRARAYLAALLYGLSLTHHRTTLLLLPAIAVFAWQTMKRIDPEVRRRLYARQRLMVLLALAAAPLLLYAYIPLAAGRAPYLSLPLAADRTLTLYDPSLGGFLSHVSGSVFGPALGPAGGLQAAGLGQRFLAEFGWPGLALGLLGLAGSLLLRSGRSRPCTWLAALSFAGLTVFNLLYGIGDIQVFYIPAFMIWTLWIGLGAWLATRGLAASRVRLEWAALALALGLLLAAGVQFRAAFPRNDRSADRSARETWEAILSQPIDPGAILVSNDRDEIVPQWYLRYVEGVRPDITGLFPAIQPGPDWSNVAQAAAQALRTQRPVFLIKPMPGLDVKFRLAQATWGAAVAAPATEGQLGALVHVEGPALEKEPDRPLNVSYADQIKLTGFDVEPAMATGGETLLVTLYWQPQRQLGEAYTTFVHVIDADGNIVGQSDHRPGGAYYPTSLWRPGELLADVHEVKLRDGLGRAPFQIIAGLYTMDPDIQNLGTPQGIGQLAAARLPDVLPADVSNRTNLIFGDQLALVGYDLSQDAERVTAGMYWQAVQPPKTDYTVFVHVLDAAGKIVAQQDQQPAAGRAPTSTWPRGYLVADAVELQLPAALPAGQYRVIAGLYDALTGARLPVVDASGRAIGDSITLGEFTRAAP